MSYGWPPRPPPTPWLRAIRELFSSDQVITERGVGANLIEVLADLTRAADRLAASIEDYNRRRREEG